MGISEASWLGCRDCGEAHVLPDHTHAPAEALDEMNTAMARFLEGHAGHRVTHLRRREDGLSAASRPLWDPLATLRIEVTDGRSPYVLTAHRDSVEEPRRYFFVEGDLPTHHPVVGIDETNIRHSLARAFAPEPLPGHLVDRFLDALRELVDRIPPATIQTSFDDAQEPGSEVAPLPENVCAELIARCAGIFPPAMLPRALAFLRENRAENGALALRVRKSLAAWSLPV